MKTLNLIGTYNALADTVELELHLLDGSTYIPEQLATGFIDLWHRVFKSGSSFTPTKLMRLDLQSGLNNSNGPMLLQFLHPIKNVELFVVAYIVLTDNTVLTYTVDNILNTNTNLNPRQYVPDQVPPAFEKVLYPDYKERGTLESREVPLPMSRVNTIEAVELNPILVRLDFTRKTPTIMSPIGLFYSGGGSRYLPNDNGELTKQLLSNAPWELGLPTFAETGITNLAVNPNLTKDTLTNSPQGYTYTTTNCTVIESINNVLTPNADTADILNTWSVEFHGPAFVTLDNCIAIEPKNSIAVDVTKILTGSMLLELVFPFDQTPTHQPMPNISALTTIVEFRDNSENLICVKCFDHVVTDYLTMSVLQWTLLPSDYPVGTTKILWRLTASSIDSGDIVKFQITAPQIEYSDSATSRTIGTRIDDFVMLPLGNDLNIPTGSFVIRFIAGHYNSTANRYYLDSRDYNGGFAIYQDTNDKFNFTVFDNTTQQNITAGTSTIFVPGTIHELVVSWQPNKRRIILDNNLLIEDTTPFTLPPNLTGVTYLGGTQFASGEFLNGEIIEFYILRDAR